jgi:hypothetical protein
MLIFNRWHDAKHATGHFSTDGTLPWSFLTDGMLPITQRLIFQPMARDQAPNGSFFNRWHAAMIIFNRWHAAKNPTAHFSTDGTLP